MEITLVKESEHRMPEPDDLERICETLDSLLRGLKTLAGLALEQRLRVFR